MKLLYDPPILSTPLLRLLPNTFVSSLEEHPCSKENLLSNGLSHNLLYPPPPPPPGGRCNCS